MTHVTTRIALLVPSRGRPDMLWNMFCSAHMQAAQPESVRLVIGLDDDDPTRDDTIERFRPTNTIIDIGPRRLLAEYWNDLRALIDADVYWHGNDDVLVRTYAWDLMVQAGFEQWPDRIGCVHGDDGIHHAGMATLGFYSRQWVAALGYVTPPYFSSDWCDTWLDECARRIGRRQYLPGMLTEHMHFVVGKAPRDLTHQERMDRGARDNVDRRYAELAPLRELDVAKLQAAIG